MTDPIIPLIMCTGAGTHLWPALREGRIKQFLRVKILAQGGLVVLPTGKTDRISGSWQAEAVKAQRGRIRPQIKAAAKRIGEVAEKMYCVLDEWECEQLARAALEPAGHVAALEQPSEPLT